MVLSQPELIQDNMSHSQEINSGLRNAILFLEHKRVRLKRSRGKKKKVTWVPKKKKKKNCVYKHWWRTLVILELGSLRQEVTEFETSRSYIMRTL